MHVCVHLSTSLAENAPLLISGAWRCTLQRAAAALVFSFVAIMTIIGTESVKVTQRKTVHKASVTNTDIIVSYAVPIIEQYIKPQSPIQI